MTINICWFPGLPDLPSVIIQSVSLVSLSGNLWLTTAHTSASTVTVQNWLTTATWRFRNYLKMWANQTQKAKTSEKSIWYIFRSDYSDLVFTFKIKQVNSSSMFQLMLFECLCSTLWWSGEDCDSCCHVWKMSYTVSVRFILLIHNMFYHLNHLEVLSIFQLTFRSELFMVSEGNTCNTLILGVFAVSLRIWKI